MTTELGSNDDAGAAAMMVPAILPVFFRDSLSVYKRLIVAWILVRTKSGSLYQVRG